MKTTQRIRRSHAQWREIFTQFEAGSLSAAAFCKQQGISYGSFMRWRQRVASTTHDTAQASADDWLPIQVTAEAEAGDGTPQGWDIELALPGGIQLRMRAR
jgi:hypothetical protein